MKDTNIILSYFTDKEYSYSYAEQISTEESIAILVKHLNEENSNPLYREDEFTKVSVQDVDFANMLFNRLHYATCVIYDEKTMLSYLNKGKWVTGVLVEQRGQRRLVDGYHRLKYMSEVKGRKSGRFIVLSN